MFNTQYTAVQIKTYSKSTSVIKVATMKNANKFLLRKGSQTTTKLSAKMNGTQKRTLL